MSRRQTTLIVLPWVALIASGLVAIAVWHTQGGQASSNETRGHISPHTIRVIRNTSDTESLVQPKETADARSLVPGGRQQQKKLHAAEELQFVDQAGNPIDNANVFWLEAIATYDPSSYMLEPNAGQGPFAISDDRGVVTIPGDKQGELIAIFARDYVPHIARLEGPASIQLTSGKTLEVEVVNAEGSLLRDSRIFVEGLAAR